MSDRATVLVTCMFVAGLIAFFELRRIIKSRPKNDRRTMMKEVDRLAKKRR